MDKRPKLLYTLKKKNNTIKLEVTAKKNLFFLYLSIFIMAIIATIMCILVLLYFPPQKGHTIVFVLIIAFIVIIFYSFYILNWKRKGKEIFILYTDRLEYITDNKPFKSTKNIFPFTKIEFCYNSGEDFFSEEEAKLLGVELDLDKVEGDYPIQFYLNDGEEVIHSERKIPVEIIRKMRDEFQTFQ